MANGTLKVSNIQTSSGSGTITLGQSGETVTIPSGATITNSGTATGFGALKSINATVNNDLSQASNNSSTMADVSGVDLVLTPTSTSSKFVLTTTVHFDTGGNTQGFNARLTYNHSGISQTEVDPAYDDYGDTVNGGGRLVGWTTQSYYLAPSTTNEITFRLQFANNGSGTVYLDRKTLRIIAWEYA